jgi:raffinose/stachyose/melibiose transport system substrate-binding protein
MSESQDSRITRRDVLARAAKLAAAGVSIGPITALLDAAGIDPLAEAAGTTTITMWANHPEWKNILQNMVGKFQAAYPSIKVQVVYKTNGGYAAALQTALAAGTAPDIIGYVEGTSIRDAAKIHQIIPLKGKVSANAFIPAARSQVQFSNNVWGAPLAAYSVGLYWQRPIFKQYGLQPPKSWAQLLDVSKTLKSKGVVAMSMPASDMIIPFFFYTMAASAVLGQSGFQSLLKGKRKLTDPDLVKAAQLMIDMIPYYNNGFQAVAYAEGKALFAEGKAAMLIGGTSDFTGYQQINPKVDVGLVGFPSPTGSRHITVVGVELNYAVNSQVSKARQQAAATFVGWLGSAQAQQIVANTIGQPTRIGIHATTKGEAGRIEREFVAAGKPALPVWIDLPQATNLLGVMAKNGGGVFTGQMSAQAFAQLSQSGLTV